MENANSKVIGRTRNHRLGLQRVAILIASAGAATFGIVVDPQVGTIAVFIAGIVSLMFLSLRRTLQSALSLLWFVRVEPAPSDLLFVWAFAQRAIGGRVRKDVVIWFIPFMALLMVNAVQLLWTLDLQRGLFFFTATSYLVGVAVLLGDSIRDTVSWSEMRDSFLWAVYVNAMVVIFLAIIFILTTSNRLAPLYYAERPRGFFKDPNVAGAFSVLGVLYAESQLLFSRKRKLALASGILSLGGVLFSFSRGALIGMIAGLIAVGVVALVARRTFRFIALLSLVGLTTMLALPVAIEAFGQSSRFQGLTEYDVRGRFAAWQAGLQVFAEAPWGIGPGAFEKGIVSYFEEYSAHNTFLRVLVENGLVGLLFLVLGLATVFRSAVSSIILTCRVADRSWLADSAWLAGSLTAVLVESWFIDTLHWRHLWVIIGLIFAHHRIMKIAASSSNL